MINRPANNEPDNPGEELPYDEALVQNWATENVLVTTTKIKALAAQIDFNQAADIEFGIPLDISAGTDIATSITEMAIRSSETFRKLMESVLDVPSLFAGIRPDIIGAVIETNPTSHMPEVFLTFHFYWPTE